MNTVNEHNLDMVEASSSRGVSQLGSQARAIYLEAHGLTAALDAAVEQTIAEVHPVPLARVAELLGQQALTPLLEHTNEQEGSVEALLRERGQLIARVDELHGQVTDCNDLRAENAKLHTQCAAAEAKVERQSMRSDDIELQRVHLEQELRTEREMTAQLTAQLARLRGVAQEPLDDDDANSRLQF